MAGFGERKRPAPDAGAIRALVDEMTDGRCKLYLTWRILKFRSEHEELFRRGEYLPLRVSGERATKVCAFARRCEGDLLITIAPRLYLRLLGDRELPPLGEEVWGNTTVELPREAMAGTVVDGDDGGYKPGEGDRSMPSLLAPGDSCPKPQPPLPRMASVFSPA